MMNKPRIRVVRADACGRHFTVPGSTLAHQCQAHTEENGWCWCPCGAMAQSQPKARVDDPSSLPRAAP
jgi:hypothetical protein